VSPCGDVMPCSQNEHVQLELVFARHGYSLRYII
jgi:hypothetical protein